MTICDCGPCSKNGKIPSPKCPEDFNINFHGTSEDGPPKRKLKLPQKYSDNNFGTYEAGSQKRKQGHPRKSLAVPVSEFSENGPPADKSSENGPQENKNSENRPPANEPLKRGRPRKSLTVPASDKSSKNGPPESIQTEFRKRNGKNIESYICPIIEKVQADKETNKNFNLETTGEDFNAKPSGSSISGKRKRQRTTKLDKNTRNLDLGQDMTENIEQNSFDSGIFLNLLIL